MIHVRKQLREYSPYKYHTSSLVLEERKCGEEKRQLTIVENEQELSPAKLSLPFCQPVDEFQYSNPRFFQH
jgi:hypothetical protein